MIQLLPAVADDLVRFDDFCVLVAEGKKADLIDGVIYMASPDSRIHIDLNGFLFKLLSDFIQAHRIDGFVFFSRFACKMNELRSPEPDVGYVRPERANLVHDTFMEGGPDIAVEIVSRESRHRDYGDKRQLYQEAGVEEYWIVDPLQHRVEFLGLQDGRYELLPLEDNHIFRSRVLSGFWLDINWLMARPLPLSYDCSRQVIAASKKRSSKRRK